MKCSILILVITCCTSMVIASPISTVNDNDIQTVSNVKSFLLSPPKVIVPVVVHPHFELYSLNAIEDELETFEFTGTLTLTWHDPRQAFDPAVEGVKEKIFQGNYQFNEISAGWYPEVTLVNRAGLYQKEGIVLRIQPDGTSTLTETLNASARSKLDMVRFPFDNQHLEAIFEILGMSSNEVQLQVTSDTGTSLTNKTEVPQWTITGSSEFVQERSVFDDGYKDLRSEFVVSFDVKRDSFYFQRLVIFPLIIIVLLSFSVFWMDRSSLGDRLNVSFIGLLTAVSYQVLINDQMPNISYFTLMNGFLSISFFVMSATVVISLFVSSLDHKRKQDMADRVDLHCRWAFPLGYFVLMLLMILITILP